MCPHCVLAILGGVAASVPALSYLHHRMTKCRKSDTCSGDSTSRNDVSEDTAHSSHEGQP